MIKKLLAIFSLLFAFSVPVFAQGVPQNCIGMFESMVNLYQERGGEVRDKQVTVKEVLAFYHEHLKKNGHDLKNLPPFAKRVESKIKEIIGPKTLTVEQMQAMLDKELKLCLDVNGDYSKLVGI